VTSFTVSLTIICEVISYKVCHWAKFHLSTSSRDR